MGLGELGVVLLVALCVLGPKEMQQLAYSLGKLTKQFKKMWQQEPQVTRYLFEDKEPHRNSEHDHR